MEKGCRFHVPIIDKVHSLLLRLSKIFSTERFATALHRKFLWKKDREIQGVSFFRGLTPRMSLAFIHKNFLWNCI